ncbi:MAG: metal ABC transporter permease [Bacilli bacterium]
MIFLVESLGTFFQDLISSRMVQYAVIAGITVGVIAPLIGTVVVIRRISFIADTLSHFSLAGVCLGVFLSYALAGTGFETYLSPLVLGVVFSIVGTLIIEKLRNYYHNYKELSMPIVMSLGVALSGIFIALSKGNANNVTNSLLFGSIYTINSADLISLIAIAVLILTLGILYYHKIVVLCFDETYAKISGLNVRRMQRIITILLALFIAVFMKLVGALLIASLMIIPVAGSILMSNSFKSSIIIAVIISEVSVFAGLIGSYMLELPTGSTIVLTNIIIFLFIIIFKRTSRSIKKA